MATTPQDITTLLQAWAQGNPEALEQLLPLVETELRHIAKRYLRRERPGHILQTTALVNEAYIKLLGQHHAAWQNREQFYGVAGLCMKRVLFSYARKRHGDDQLDSQAAYPLMSAAQSSELLRLETALKKLSKLEPHGPRQSRVMTLKHFGGYTVEEIAGILKISEATVARDLRFSRAWLYRELGRV